MSSKVTRVAEKRELELEKEMEIIKDINVYISLFLSFLTT